MTAPRDPDRLIHAFLLEGAEKLPDQVYDSVRADIEQRRQRVVIGPWRAPTLKKLVPIGLAAAAVVAVLLLGPRLLGSPAATVGGPGVVPTATPAASVAEPSVAASPTSAAGSIPEGEYLLFDGGREDDGARGPAITVTVPAGWYGDEGSGIIMDIPPVMDFGPGDVGMIGPFLGDIYVPADPCQWSTTMPDAPATTVEEVVAALQSQASRDASEATAITVDGHAGQSITLRVPDDAKFGLCDTGEFCTLTEVDPTVCHRYQQFPGQIDELWILDVNGQVTVMDASWSDTTPAEAVSEARAILQSMTFETP